MDMSARNEMTDSSGDGYCRRRCGQQQRKQPLRPDLRQLRRPRPPREAVPEPGAVPGAPEGGGMKPSAAALPPKVCCLCTQPLVKLLLARGDIFPNARTIQNMRPWRILVENTLDTVAPSFPAGGHHVWYPGSSGKLHHHAAANCRRCHITC